MPAATGIDLLGGGDLLEFQAGADFGTGAFVAGGDDDDTIQVDAGLDEFDLGLVGDADPLRDFETLDVSAPATVTLSGANGSAIDVVGDDEVDQMTLAGTLTGNVRLRGGADVFRLQGSLSGDIDGGDGDDQLVLAAGVNALDLSRALNFELLSMAEAAAVTLSGVGAIDNVVGGAASDTIRVTGTLTGDIDLAGGNDVFIIDPVAGTYAINVNGLVQGGAHGGGSGDIIRLAAGASSTFDLNSIGTTLLGFETLHVPGDPGAPNPPDEPTVVQTLTGNAVIQVVGNNHRDSLRLIGRVTGISLFEGSDILAVRGDFTGPGGAWADGGVTSFANLGGGNDVLYIESGEPFAGGGYDGDAGSDSIILREDGDPTTPRPILETPDVGFFNFEHLGVWGGAALSPGGMLDDVEMTLTLDSFFIGLGGGQPGQRAEYVVTWGPGDAVDTIELVNATGTTVATVGDVIITVAFPPGADPFDQELEPIIVADTVIGPDDAPQFNFVDLDPDDEDTPWAGLIAFTNIDESSEHGDRPAFNLGWAIAPPPGPGMKSSLSAMAGALLTGSTLGGVLDTAGGHAGSSVGFAGLGFRSGGWVGPGGGYGLQTGFTQRSFTTDLGGMPAQASTTATRSFVSGPIWDGRAIAGLGAGLEQVSYDGEGEGRHGQLDGRARAGYVAAYLGTEVALWHIDAALDTGPVTFNFDAPGFERYIVASGTRTRAELAASRRMDVAGAPVALDFGVRWANLDTGSIRRGDAAWVLGPNAQFTAASAGLSLGRVWGLAPYARASEAVDGEAEEFRLVGLRRIAPAEGFAFDASLGEVSEPYAGEATKGEVRLNWKF